MITSKFYRKILGRSARIRIRKIIAPMMADRTFYQAIPGLADSLPDALRLQVLAMRAAPVFASHKSSRFESDVKAIPQISCGSELLARSSPEEFHRHSSRSSSMVAIVFPSEL